jgi:hypothetical protein
MDSVLCASCVGGGDGKWKRKAGNIRTEWRSIEKDSGNRLVMTRLISRGNIVRF